MSGVGSFLKRALPAPLVREVQYWQHRLRRGRVAKNGAGAAFSDVYASKAWGDDGTDFYSGPGTIEEAVTRPYQDFLAGEFAAMKKPPRVLDLGCGDFKIGAQIAPLAASYTGVDVVAALVQRNTAQFGSDSIRFLCAEISTDPLPEADVVLVREVMQHMSNAQIGRLLARLGDFPIAYVTNVEPEKSAVAVKNRDLVPGPDTRGVFGSALFLDEPPFSFAARMVLEVPTGQTGHGKMTITTRKVQR